MEQSSAIPKDLESALDRIEAMYIPLFTLVDAVHEGRSRNHFGHIAKNLVESRYAAAFAPNNPLNVASFEKDMDALTDYFSLVTTHREFGLAELLYEHGGLSELDFQSPAYALPEHLEAPDWDVERNSARSFVHYAKQVLSDDDATAASDFSAFDSLLSAYLTHDYTEFQLFYKKPLAEGQRTTYEAEAYSMKLDTISTLANKLGFQDVVRTVQAIKDDLSMQNAREALLIPEPKPAEAYSVPE